VIFGIPKYFSVFLALSAGVFSLKGVQTTSSDMTEHLVAQKIETLIGRMTLEEKIGQMTQVRHFADIEEEEIATRFIGSVIHTEGEVPGETAIEWQEKFRRLQEIARSTRLGIPLLFGVDAVHGQNTYEGATIFPHNIGMGAAANAELVRSAAEITALESRATGFNWVFSPCVAIPYNERWGRVYEAYSESTELTETLARASVLGHQGEHLGPQGVMATAKHFIGDGATDFGKEGGETSLSVTEVKKHLLGPYQAAIESGVGSVMVSFNTLEGIPMHAHKGMITGLLKEAMGFEGIVVSDWKGYSKYGENDKEPLYLGFFHTGAYQDSISGYGGIKHCLIPSPKHVIIDRDEKGNFVDYVYRNEQSADEMFKILGYNKE